jgi:predicted NAD/FAD-binding protein
MKVAIMGAGFSGLSCALTLENNSINPTEWSAFSAAGWGGRFLTSKKTDAVKTASYLARPWIKQQR